MSFVQSAHGGHEPQGLAVTGQRTTSCPHVGDGCNAFHGLGSLVRLGGAFEGGVACLGVSSSVAPAGDSGSGSVQLASTPANTGSRRARFSGEHFNATEYISRSGPWIKT